MKIIFSCLSLIYLSLGLFDQNQIESGTLYLPYHMEINNEKLFVADSKDMKIKIYEVKGMRFVGEFGKKGEGPGEYLFPPTFKILLDKIIVSSGNKILYFDLLGNYLSERIISDQFIKIEPIKDEYIIAKLVRDPDGFKVSFQLLDPNFKYKIELHKGEGIFRKDRKRNLFEILFIDTTKDSIIYAHMDGSAIDICDYTGKLLKKIEIENESTRFTEKDHDLVVDYWKRTPPFNKEIDFYKRITIFPKYFPSIMTCILDNNNIYVISYRRKNNKFVTTVFDFNGNIIKQVLLPIKYSIPISYLISPFTIKDRIFYQLVENDQNGNWFLFSSKIEFN